MSVVGTRIKERRINISLTQEQLAAMVEISQKQISRYESRYSDPTGDVIIALARALNTSADYLLGMTDDPTPPSKRDEHTEIEHDVLSAMRRGDRTEAARLILNN